MLADYHMHLIHDGHEGQCPYTLERIEEYLRAAEANGIDEIGITDHCDRFREFRPVMEHLITGPGTYEAVTKWLSKRFSEPLDEYVETLVQAKQRGWPVKAGLEVDYIPGMEDAIREILAVYPWDYVLGSVHFIGKWGIDISPDSGWPERDVDQVYEEYFDLLVRAAGSGLYDVLAHPDLVKKFGHRPRRSPTPLYEKLVDAVAQAGIAIELSTAGIRRGEKELYPAPEVMEMCAAEGIPITLASDAHYPEHIGADFNRALDECERVGYTHFTRFEERTRVPEPLS